MAHLSETNIVQAYDKGFTGTEQFKLALIRWLCSATESEVDILVAEMLHGFAESQ
jgi:hypothetical protein